MHSASSPTTVAGPREQVVGRACPRCRASSLTTPGCDELLDRGDEHLAVVPARDVRRLAAEAVEALLDREGDARDLAPAAPRRARSAVGAVDAEVLHDLLGVQVVDERAVGADREAAVPGVLGDLAPSSAAAGR